VRLTFQSPD